MVEEVEEGMSQRMCGWWLNLIKSSFSLPKKNFKEVENLNGITKWDAHPTFLFCYLFLTCKLLSCMGLAWPLYSTAHLAWICPFLCVFTPAYRFPSLIANFLTFQPFLVITILI